MQRLFGCLAVASVLALAGAARADCGSGSSQDEIKLCLAQALRDSDARINAVYKSIMDGRDAAGKIALRDEQRAWLKSRDKACGLDNKESDREKWLQAILADQAKTVCVVRYTFARVAQLDELLTKASAAPPPSLPSAPQPLKFGIAAAAEASVKPPNGLTFLDDGYQPRTAVAHDRGKWYCETWIDAGHIAELGDVLLTSGVISVVPGQGGVVRLINIRHGRTDSHPTSIGWAVDLDNGAVYVRSNGTWSVAPGSMGGPKVKLNRQYRGCLEGSSAVSELVRRGLVKVNLGDRPFDYSLPEGYRPFAE